VVMFENVQKSGDDMIEVLKPVAPGENIIQAGEDIKQGILILKRHHLLRPQDIAALAGLGITDIAVFKKPVIGIVSTGDEIVPPDKPLKPGQVRDINSFNLVGLIKNAGGVPERYGIFPDKYDVLHGIIKRAVGECDMVLVSGGSSVGTRDMTADIIKSMEENGVLFHGVAVKPGKPLIGGFVKGRPIFGLPGHPAAVSVSFMNFVEPLLKKMAGIKVQYKKESVHTVDAILAKNLSSAAGREDHVRVALVEKDGILYANPVLGKSGLITTLVYADGLVTVPEQAQGIAKGEKVKVRVFKI
jgi:molybdopterin molybdotransferase